MNYQENRAWSDKYLPAVKRIVGPLLLEAAPLEEDTKHATDLIILKARDKRIACRIRRPVYADKYPYEFTIRSQLDSGQETELNKLVNGFGDWFFYGFATDEDDIIGIARWMVIDLSAWRAHLIRRTINMGKKKANGDGTHFVAFDVRLFTGAPRVLVDASFDVPGPPELPLFAGMAP